MYYVDFVDSNVLVTFADLLCLLCFLRNSRDGDGFFSPLSHDIPSVKNVLSFGLVVASKIVLMLALHVA